MPPRGPSSRPTSGTSARPDDAGAGRAALARRAPPRRLRRLVSRSSTRSSARSSSAAGTTLTVWTNPPPHLLRDEVAPHADVARRPGAGSPSARAPARARRRPLGDGTWRVEVGIANTGWLPTYVTAWRAKRNLVAPDRRRASTGANGASHRRGRAVRPGCRSASSKAGRRRGSRRRNDGTPDRALVSWVVRAPRAGRRSP